MSTAQQLQITEQQFLDGECETQVKHEFIDGQVYAMTSATIAHNRISGNVFGEIRQQLKGQLCEALFADVLLKAGTNLFYPDIMVTCGDDEADTTRVKHAPTIIVEVLSRSTRRTDITTKKNRLPKLALFARIHTDRTG
jgi:Uma2 family endonuclease